MTRFSNGACLMAAVVWLVARNECETALVQGRLAATVATVEERQAYNTNEANLATRTCFLSKSQTDDRDNHVKGKGRKEQHSE
jgi:hypothetical protein